MVAGVALGLTATPWWSRCGWTVAAPLDDTMEELPVQAVPGFDMHGTGRGSATVDVKHETARRRPHYPALWWITTRTVRRGMVIDPPLEPYGHPTRDECVLDCTAPPRVIRDRRPRRWPHGIAP
jgi:hypothetical protein